MESTPNDIECEITKIKEFTESAKAAALKSLELHEQVNATLTDAKAKLAEIAVVAEQSIAASESQERIAAALGEAQAKCAEIANIATQAVAAKTQITDCQSVIATKSEHIEAAQTHADKVRADLDRTLTSAMQQATDTEGHKSRAQSVADTAVQLLSSIQTTKGGAEKDTEAIVAARKIAEESAIQTKGLAEKSSKIEDRISAYEQSLGSLQEQCSAQLKTIESLLPGATGAGLAHAFDQRRQAFLRPIWIWQSLFVASVFALVLLAIHGLRHVYAIKTIPTYDELVRLWLSRFPIAGALLWLALHASRESALAKRLEEDYGYKSAIASSFQGFHKQMTEIGAATSTNVPLNKLCEDTLATIADPPGRIYEKHPLVTSPLHQLTETTTETSKVLTAASKAIADVKGLP